MSRGSLERFLIERGERVLRVTSKLLWSEVDPAWDCRNQLELVEDRVA